MAAIDLERAFRNPGRLTLNPSVVYGVAYPGTGGTAFGLPRDIELDWGYEYKAVVAEEWGERTETIRKREFPSLAFTIYQWDPDVVGQFFASVTTSSGPTSIPGIARINGGARPGLVTAMSPLVFWPDNPQHPGVVIHRPIPRVVAPVRFGREEDIALVLVVDATRNSNDRSYQCDLLEHLVLT